MVPQDFAEQVAGVAALADPVRRRLYLYVAAQPGPVTRDQAGAAVDVPRHTAKFHLDKLVAEGLLDTDFKRPSGRGGPGAGRPSKRYRRSAPPGQRRDTRTQVRPRRPAHGNRHRRCPPRPDPRPGGAAPGGRRPGDDHRRPGPSAGRPSADPREAGRRGLRHAGRPRIRATARRASRSHLTNCPFHALAQEHTDLVCGMNLALIQAAVSQLDDDTLHAKLDPAEGRCCVAITTDPG